MSVDKLLSKIPAGHYFCIYQMPSGHTTFWAAPSPRDRVIMRGEGDSVLAALQAAFKETVNE